MIHILLLFVGCIVPFALGCVCGHDHPQNSFCRATAVFRGKVIEETLTRNERFVIRRRYTLEVQKIYKDESKENLAEGSPVNVSAPGDNDSCGTSLTLGDVYIISAYDEIGFRLDGCTEPVDLTGYTPAQIEQIKYEYDCRCTVYSRFMESWQTVKDSERHKYCFYMFEDMRCQLSSLCSLDETTNQCSFCKKTK